MARVPLRRQKKTVRETSTAVIIEARPVFAPAVKSTDERPNPAVTG